MADTAQLEAAVRYNERQAEAARGRVGQLRLRLGDVRKEIEELEHELSDLHAFGRAARRDIDELHTKLVERQRVLDEMDALADVSLAGQLASRLLGIQREDAWPRLNEGGRQVDDEVERGKSALRQAIRALRERAAGIERDIETQRGLIARYEGQARMASAALQDARANGS